MKLLSEADISRMADELAEVATSPQLMNALHGVQGCTSEGDAVAEAKKIASVEYLGARGLQPPKDFRITTRSFEPPEQAPVPDANGLVVAFEDGKLTVACDGWVVSVNEA